jgi:HK97 gp10 family phage protein
MKIDVKSIRSKLFIYVNLVKKEAQKYIKSNAYDTGDMDRAVTVTEVTEQDGVFECTVYVDKNALYNKRIKYKSSTKIYPVYVHQGTSKMPARPYFDIAYEQVKKEFKDITPTIKVENDNKGV